MKFFRDIFEFIGESLGCAGTIFVMLLPVLITVAVFNFCDSPYYISHDPVSYCNRFPHGRHEEQALKKIVDGLSEGDYFYTSFKGSQKKFAEFALEHENSEYGELLKAYSETFYKAIKKYYSKTVFPRDFERAEERVEEKHVSEIIQMRTKLERGWRVESIAWGYVEKVLNENDSHFQYRTREALEMYLSYHPRGKHAIDAYELKDELPDDTD